MTNVVQNCPVWHRASNEIYDNLYQAVKAELDSRSILPVRVGESIYCLSNSAQIRRGIAYHEFGIRTKIGWKYMPVAAMDELASLLGVIGPTNHFNIVADAIAHDYIVPEHVIDDHRSVAGDSKKARHTAKHVQLTRVVTTSGFEAMPAFDMPEPHQIVHLVNGSKSRNLDVLTVDTYRSLDRTWIIVDRADERAHRIYLHEQPTGARVWTVEISEEDKERIYAW